MQSKNQKMHQCFAVTRNDQMIQAIAVISIPDTHFSCTCCVSRTTRHRTLEAFFGIDQSTVCRYLQFCGKMLKETLPTPDRISKAMSKCKTVKGIKEFVPGRRGAGTLLVDGTHIRVDRPGEKEERKKTYTGKKKNHTNNTTIISTTDNIIVGISKTAVGSTHDLKMIKEHSIPFGRWTRKMRDEDTPAKERFTMYMDL